MPFLFDLNYIFLVAIPAILITGGASILLRILYGRNKNKANQNGLTGADVAAKINDHYGFGAGIGVQDNKLVDNYNPREHVVTLSAEVAHNPSVAAVAIAAHEFGHVQQYNSNSLMIRFRSALIPLVNIGSNLGYFLIFIGLIVSLFELTALGIVLFSFSTIFSLLTLPVEIDASRRGLKMIRELNLLPSSQIGGAKQVLSAAAMTYIAAAIVSILNLIYYIALAGGQRE